MHHYSKTLLLACMLCTWTTACDKDELDIPAEKPEQVPGGGDSTTPEKPEPEKPDTIPTEPETPEKPDTIPTEPEKPLELKLNLELQTELVSPDNASGIIYEFDEQIPAVALLRQTASRELIYLPLMLNRNTANKQLAELKNYPADLKGKVATSKGEWQIRLLLGGQWNATTRHLTFEQPQASTPAAQRTTLKLDRPYFSAWQTIPTDTAGQFTVNDNGLTPVHLQVQSPALTLVHHFETCDAEAQVEISQLNLTSEALSFNGYYDLSDSVAIGLMDQHATMSWKVKPDAGHSFDLGLKKPLTVTVGNGTVTEDYIYMWAMPTISSQRNVKVTAAGRVMNKKQDTFTDLEVYNQKLPETPQGVQTLHSAIRIPYSPEIEGPITLSTADDKTTLIADGTDEVQFIVRQAGVDVTAECIIYQRDGLFENEIINKRFRTKRTGSYEFYAVKGKEHSNHIHLTAKTNEETDADGNLLNGTKFAPHVTAQSGWYDVNKKGNGNTSADGLLCWAAASSNILQWWLDDFKQKGHNLPASVPYGQGKKYKLAIFDTFFDCWVNYMHSTKPGVRWFMEGGGMQHASSNSATPDKGGVIHDGGYFRHVLPEAEEQALFASNYIEEYGAYSNWIVNTGTGQSMHERFSRLFLRLIGEGVTALSIDSHELTAWGCDVSNGLVTRIYVTNSDDGSDCLTSYKVEEQNGDIHLIDYPGKTYQPTQIIRFTRMKAYGK